MKKIFIITLISAFLFVDAGCKKATETAIDCIVESMFATLHATPDDQDARLMHFKFSITTSDGVTLDPTLHWNFGDGHSLDADTVSDHTYTDAGSYEVIVSYTLRKGSASCSTTKNKSITIN